VIQSPRGKLLLEAARRNLELIREHGEKVSNAEANEIVIAIASHIRSWKPLAISPMPTTTEKP
jgi:hypothetical protein